MKGRETVFLLVAASLMGLAEPTRAGEIAEPNGYRMDDYRAPVPPTLQGARVVTTAEAEALWRAKKAVFFDVMPNTPKPTNLPAGTIWRDKVRKDIPGSTWLANVGYGAISQETTSYFRQGLEAKAGTDKSRAILFYCMTNCWMSWNAAKRAIEWGYSSVIWYPLGADGWEGANLPLEVKKPYETNN
ncbi:MULTISPECIES: PQQ-dependent catabolism-associated CXXCW motif protein [unclassified Mesorhizobium]|uniref:PQQ-dependent catabolism-associated CXXCW motif protein n=1 Tax=unclassified Mesorhizobium TaxID=325217 RepID=UPI001128A865|nr:MULTISPECIES: PQQ-dependent catabolism-associated CXXCW motif protein [unclassified Mesorhizobium]TPJ43925.1 PQQ-dependent catabolism-associated CXXCW motif protein [Mesorhizobium sp. B2-6-6]MBZ9916657.1 PQQ-dependent catabolism-associated CXXCW motif protein [Mesorhizobium sp. BR1-1-7]MBZ9954443.1 PQQ-dependent catabolism-associated CXXCW motif protein [Mesorhizobium sp. BR1-1-15]MBZ9971592.1 PQQ-dependent catabolism-associated CXXCW motif protein [Mesorhizobium sp. BR1-1-12]MCA0002257.1 P